MAWIQFLALFQSCHDPINLTFVAVDTENEVVLKRPSQTVTPSDR